MEGFSFAWIVFVILWWVISRMAKNQKANSKNQQSRQPTDRISPQKAAPQTKPAPPPAPKPQPAAMSQADEWEDEEDSWDERDTKRGQQSIAPRVKPQPVQASAAVKHTAKPFEAHMHTPAMGVEGEGTEGIDCCHDFMLGNAREPEPADFLPLQEEGQTERAKALLQGVIYSEILGRRSVKRYHVKQS